MRGGGRVERGRKALPFFPLQRRASLPIPALLPFVPVPPPQPSSFLPRFLLLSERCATHPKSERRRGSAHASWTSSCVECIPKARSKVNGRVSPTTTTGSSVHKGCEQDVDGEASAARGSRELRRQRPNQRRRRGTTRTFVRDAHADGAPVHELLTHEWTNCGRAARRGARRSASWAAARTRRRKQAG